MSLPKGTDKYFSHHCVLTDKIISGLHALKAEYVKTEALMNDPENVRSVQSKLKLINNNFDELILLCCFIRDDETMPGSTSHKIDVIEGKGTFGRKVEDWLSSVGMPEVPVCSGETDTAVGPLVGVTCNSNVGASEINALVDDCDELLGGVKSISGKTSSTSSSRSSRIRTTRVKVRLAQLALRQEGERQKEQIREKERQLEMAEAELEAWETESIASGAHRDCERMSFSSQSADLCKVRERRSTSKNTDLYKAGRRCQSEIEPARGMQVQKKFQPAATAEEPQFEPEHGRHGKGTNSYGYQRYADTLSYRQSPPHFSKIVDATPNGSSCDEIGERFLPNPTIEHFDGDPLDYGAFVSRFKVHIADRLRSDDLKLVYLPQHCSKKVHEKIKHHAIGGNKQECYRRVWNELRDRYGQPHVIGRHCEQLLLDLPKINQYDADGL